MLKKIVLILVLILAVGSVCFAAEKEIANKYYYIGAKRIDNNTLGAKTKMIGADGSTCVYTYIIDIKSKSSTETMIEVFDANRNKIGNCKTNVLFTYGDQSYPLATIIVDETLKEIAEKENKK